jgi:lipopolysaccharide/colanic/teichoic acid biosynthesis glycosyltransferase
MLDHPISERTSARATLAPVQRRIRSDFGFYGIGKRLVDLALVAVGGPFFLPLILILVVLIRLDGGPAFFLQPRVGKNGRIFRLWKLRTMVPNAEAALASYLDSNPGARAEWDSAQKLRNDPRLTFIGGFLRRYSLDELPQLWNVLIGDMSLVGPRPMMPSQRALYPGTAYYDLRPGLTGLWQISERNNCTFADRAAYDNRYAQSVSVGVDFAVLVKTLGVVFRGTGC